MQLSYLLPLALAATSLASPFAKRDAATVVADFGIVSDKVKSLNDSVTAFKSSNDFITALQIQQKSTDVLNALNQTNNDAAASAPFTEDEAISIAQAVVDLQPVVITTLDNLESKKETFGTFLSPIVASSLKDQRAATVKLSDTITSKVPEDLQAAAPTFVQPILDKFDEAIKTFSGSFSFPSGGFPTGGFSFPTGFPKA